MRLVLDRLREAEWFVHMMEANYHEADKFRWSFNSFLRTLKEVVQLISMEVQNKPSITEWYRKEREKLNEDSLVRFLYKQRDVVVHKSMLKPASRGMIGFTRGRGMKLGVGTPINPLEDSRVAVLRYIAYCASEKDFMGILYSEEDGSGEYTCVERNWRLDEFPDEELTALAARAWDRVADLTLEVAKKLGAEVIKPKIELGNPHEVHFEIYDPAWIKKQMILAKERIASD